MSNFLFLRRSYAYHRCCCSLSRGACTANWARTK